jgi:hypothetical protein
MAMNQSLTNRYLNIVVIVASLGYFVDIYDLILFGIVKNPSLIDLGITGKDALFSRGYFLLFRASPALFYFILFLLGIPMGGLWAVFITSASEQFGTNMRATVTTSAPNFVRGSTILITFLLGALTPVTGLWFSGVIVGIIFICVAIVSALLNEETYGKELDYIEES